MSNVAEIAAHVARIGEEAGQVAAGLDYEAEEISSLMERIQATFGGQRPGQRAVTGLYRALTRTIGAASAMRDEEAHGLDFVAKIRS